MPRIRDTDQPVNSERPRSMIRPETIDLKTNLTERIDLLVALRLHTASRLP